MYYDKLTNLGIKLRRRGGAEKTQCPKCSEGRRNKKDPCLSVNITNGDYNCHNCSWKGNVRFTDKRIDDKVFTKPPQSMLSNIELNENIIKYFEDRKISKNTLDKFFIHGKEEWMPQTQKKQRCIVFPFMRNGEIVNAKFRDGAKNFKLMKDAEMIFFGMQTLKGKHCAIITEGEIDALSCYECGFANEYQVEPNEDGVVIDHPLGMYAVLSVPNGASRGSQKMEYLDNSFESIMDIDEFIIATDNDEAGIELKDELIRRIGVEKCRILRYPTERKVNDKDGNLRSCKDLNEVLNHYGAEYTKNLILSSETIPIEGINYLEDIFDSMLTNFRKGVQLAPTTRFEIVDKHFRWKKGDINLISGYANYGKTTFILQLMLIKSIYDGWKWAIFSPENFPANDFYDDLVEMYVGKWLDKITEQEYVGACKFIGEHFFYVYPENEHDLESIHAKFRYLVLKKGVDGVMIDPFNQLDRVMKFGERDDQYLSECLKVIKRFALLNAVCYNVVAHPKNPTYSPNKQLDPPEIYDIAQGAMWANKVDNAMIYHRPKFSENKNSREIQIRQVKTKRKRTGGENGEYDLVMLWESKRFCDPLTNEVPCNPQIASVMVYKENNDYSQSDLGLDDVPF